MTDAPTAHLFSVANAAGLVIRTGRVPFESWIEKQACQPGEQAVAGALDAATQWVSGGLVAHRPANPAALTGTTLTNLPTPCTVYIDGTAYACTDDHVELDLAVAKVYTIKVEAFPVQDAIFELSV